MISYIIQVSISWIFFYGVYHLFLRKETFFNINRYYLMGSLILSLFIPQIGELLSNWFTTSPADAGSVVYFISEAPLVIENIVASETPSLSFIEWALLLTYLTGVSIVGSKFLLGLRRIYNLYSSGKKRNQEQFTLVETNGIHLPFSFFQYVFISKKIPLQKHIEKIIRHELTHVEKLHSLDILLIEALHIFFWFNPVLLLYKKAIRQSHEYQADASVLSGTDIKNYGQILLGQSSSGLEVALANHFFNSQIKNRITMMYRKKSTRSALIKYLAAVPVLLFMAFIFSNATNMENGGKAMVEGSNIITNSSDTIPPPPLPVKPPTPPKAIKAPTSPSAPVPPPPPPPPPAEDLIAYKYSGEVFRKVDQMPRFPGCEELSGNEREECSKKNLLEFIYKNISYPKEAKDAGIYGTVVAQFVINKDGSVRDVNLLRDIGGNCGEVTVKVIESMNSMPERWIPGVQDGKKVDVVYTLPVRFKLADGQDKSKKINELEDPYKVKRDVNKVADNGNPLIVIDDVVSTNEILEGINPDEIEVIHILKGESAKEKYGQKAVDGAIEVITKGKIDASKESAPLINLTLPDEKNQPLIILDGKEVLPDIKNNLKPDDIASINVLKGEKALEKYGNKAKNGVVEITTKGNETIKLKADKIIIKDDKKDIKSDVIDYTKEENPLVKKGLEDQPLYILDGEEIDQVKMEEINPNIIKSINVLKGKKAFEKYGDKAENGVVEVFSKYSKERTNDIGENIKLDLPKPSKAEEIIISGPATIKFNSEDKGDKIYFLNDKKSSQEVIARLAPQAIDRIDVSKDKASLKKFGPKVKEIWHVYTFEKKSSNNKKADQKEVLTKVEQMPRFPGCENNDMSLNEKEDCAKKEMLMFIYKNIRYPKEARDAGIEGMNVVQFTVMKDGSIDDISVVRSIGGGTDEAVLSIMDKMVLMEEKWVPGMQDGKPVNVRYTLPIRFKLEGDSKKKDKVEAKKKQEMNASREEKVKREKLVEDKIKVERKAKEKVAAENFSISKLQQEDFLTALKVFPNPTTDEVNVEVNGPPSPLEIRVHDIAGKLLYRQSIIDFNGSYKGTLRSENFINTQAVISFIQEGKVQSQKVIFSK